MKKIHFLEKKKRSGVGSDLKSSVENVLRANIGTLTLFSSEFRCVISINTVDLKNVWKTLQTLIRWLCQRPADLELHYFLKRIYPVQQDKGICPFCTDEIFHIISSFSQKSLKYLGPESHLNLGYVH